LLLAGCGGVVLAGWYVKQQGFLEARADTILTATAARGDLVITVTERGELESSQSLTVSCDIEGGGKLVSIKPEGTRVAAGEEVARFDTDIINKAISAQEVKCGQAEAKIKASESELEVQRNKSESEIAKAELALTLAKIDFESYEKAEYEVELAKRTGANENAKKDLKDAEDALEFNRSLVKKGLAQPQQLRALELRVDATRLIVRQQQADIKVLTDFVRRRKNMELEAKAKDADRELTRTKKSQEAASEKALSEVSASKRTAKLEDQELKRLQAQLDKCVVKAPDDGIVIYSNQRPWDPTSQVRPGSQLHYQQQLFSLPDLDKMQVKLKVHESVVKKVVKDLPVTMQVDALPNRVLHGKVLNVGSVAQNDGWRGGGVKEYQTEVSIEDLPADAGLRPGMTAEVKILIKTIENALTVPVQAVTEVDGKHVCYLVKEGKPIRTEVEVGESNEQLIQVLAGIQESDEVALDARLRASAELKQNAGKAKSGTPEDDKSKTEKGKQNPATPSKSSGEAVARS